MLAGDVSISEFQASNQSTLLDEDGDTSDWIEVHNASDGPVNLAGWHLTDAADELTKWSFPSLVIGPQEYLVVFTSGKDRIDPAAELHTNFRLSADGEFLALVEPSALTIVSDFGDAFPAQTPDVSFGVGSSGQLHYFATPTPGQPNGPGSYLGVTTEPTFSVESGFYDSEFTVTLSVPSPTADIRYTLDSSVPTRSSPRYTEPITIRGMTIVRAATFEIGYLTSGDAVRSYFFLDDVIAQDGAGLPETWGTFTYSFPLGPYEAGDPVPANYEMDAEVTGDPRYEATIRDDLQSLPSLSLILDPVDLWSESTGIYSNPLQSGPEWERPVTAELINPDGSIAFRVDAGGRINGAFSRRPSASAKHSIRLLFKSDYGPTKLAYPWFGDAAADEFDTVVLRASYNFSWSRGERNNSQHAEDGTFVQDRWAAELQNEMGGLAPHGTWVHLYLNGLYWGLFNPNERPDSTFLASYLGGRTEDYDVIKNQEIVDGDDAEWRALLSLVRQRPLDYQVVARAIDMPNFMDYVLINQFAGNEDWPHNNWYASRRQTDDAQWQFHSWDAEYLFRDVQTNRVTATNQIEGGPGEIFRRLRSVPEFQRQFGDRIQRHFFAGGALTPERNIARLDRVAAPIDRAIVGESARWGDALFNNIHPPLTRDDHWLPRLEELRNEYFPQRNAVVLQQYRDVGLYPRVDAPTWNHPGGLVPAGFTLTATAPEGRIYITRDGADPRMADGSVNPDAIDVTSPLVLDMSQSIKARVLSNGEWSALVETDFIVDQPLSLKVTEFLYHPQGLDDGPVDADAFEFVEVTNVGAEEINLLGATFQDGFDFVFPSIVLQPGERVVVVHDEVAFAVRYGEEVRVAGEFQRGQLGNREDTIHLLDARGETLSRIAYTDEGEWSTRADGLGASLEVVDVLVSAADFGMPGNWQASVQRHGSPGAESLPRNTTIDLLFAGLRAVTPDPFYDFDESGTVDEGDVTVLVEERWATRRGDANLDGRVDFEDFLRLSASFHAVEALWQDGDFNGDGLVNFADFLLLSSHFGYGR